MKGNQKIIEVLNGLLAMELAAMDQYFIHSQMYLDWGLHKLYDRISHEFDDEKGHATVLIERMLFLEGLPDMVTRDGFKVATWYDRELVTSWGDIQRGSGGTAPTTSVRQSGCPAVVTEHTPNR